MMAKVVRLNTFASVPAAMKALARLEVEIKSAKSFAALDAAARKAAAIQRFAPVKGVSDKGGMVWTRAEIRLDEEIKAAGKATGSRGRGKKGAKRGALVAPRIDAPPTLAELGLPGAAGKKRAARAAKLAVIPEQKLAEVFKRLEDAGKGITPNAVLVEIRKQAKAEKVHRVATAAFSADGPFGIVVIDPPWPVQKIDRDERLNQDAFDYKTMTVEQLLEWWKAEMVSRLERDVHLFMWTTQKYLPATINLLEPIGFNYVLTMVWHKAGGFQPHDLPQYNCEFVVYARRGSPVFITTKDFPCCFDGERREHSRKPDRFYDIVRRVTGGSRIDVFSRETRDGFAQFGNESSKFDVEAAE